MARRHSSTVFKTTAQKQAAMKQRVRSQSLRPAPWGAHCERLVIRFGKPHQMKYCGRTAKSEIDGVPYCPHHLALGVEARFA